MSPQVSGSPADSMAAPDLEACLALGSQTRRQGRGWGLLPGDRVLAARRECWAGLQEPGDPCSAKAGRRHLRERALKLETPQTLVYKAEEEMDTPIPCLNFLGPCGPKAGNLREGLVGRSPLVGTLVSSLGLGSVGTEKSLMPFPGGLSSGARPQATPPQL